MTEWLDTDGRALWQRVSRLIAHDDGTASQLAGELFAWQRRNCVAIDRVARAFGAGADRIPGIPTDAFRSARIACFPPEATQRTFLTSGTVGEIRGRHEFADLALYDQAAFASARRWLLPGERYRFVLLAEHAAATSSLAYMLARFAEQWAADDEDVTCGVVGGALQLARIDDALARSARDAVPVALLGASFAFVHLADACASRWRLPPGSVVMPTGGFKGRARELAPEALFGLIVERFGVERAQIVQEYGMTELSSQAYASCAGRYVAPHWMRVVAVDPETLAPLEHGATGLLEVIDLANVGSCIAIQTSDVGVTWPDGFEVHGRAQGATARGCARALDAVLMCDE